ncbi:MAG: DUF480 domain-containing protein, partial [Acidimicrobiales bacterium]
LYPLTLNSLVAACNQSSNRHPVANYGPAEVSEALAELRRMGLARVVHSASYRAEKYRHVADEAWALSPGEMAILAVLALRGAQTASELRTRTDRYPGVEEMGGPLALLERLSTRYAEPFVVRLGRQPGQREERWAQLLGGEPEAEDAVMPSSPARSPSAIAALEARVSALENDIAELRSVLADRADSGQTHTS